jgi:hypothetical protein
MPKYPDIRIQLIGKDGNAYFILGRIYGVIKNKLPKEEQDAFFAEAKSGDYDHLLRTCMKWFDCR